MKFADNDRPQEEGKDTVLTPLPRCFVVDGRSVLIDQRRRKQLLVMGSYWGGVYVFLDLPSTGLMMVNDGW